MHTHTHTHGQHMELFKAILLLLTRTGLWPQFYLESEVVTAKLYSVLLCCAERGVISVALHSYREPMDSASSQEGAKFQTTGPTSHMQARTHSQKHMFMSQPPAPSYPTALLSTFTHGHPQNFNTPPTPPNFASHQPLTHKPYFSLVSWP